MSLWIFLLAASLFNAGLSIYFLLYNLYLLDLGFNESFLGILWGAMTVGSICGSMPAGWLASRWGLGPALRLGYAGAAAVCALRAWATGRLALAALAFLGGLISSLWVVCVAPVVAQLTPESRRPRAFSLVFALGIGMGIIGGLLGGKLPEWVLYWNLGPLGPESARASKQLALWMGSGLAALALVPTLWLKLSRAAPEEGKSNYPRTPFMLRFLAAGAVWNLFVGAFPPFFNAYFARRFSAGTAEIGLAYSVSQLAQVTAVLVAPMLFARLGLVTGIAATQAAAALLLALVPPMRAMAPAAALYSGYMAFLWMSEPGWNSLLMNQVAPEQRSGASAMNFFVIYSTQALAAASFGAAVPRLGYSVVIMSTAAVGLSAAWVFRRLLAGTADSTTLQTSSR
ncbi:MAG: MFS transporter [Acidobacteria bacterium]|nr:MFS transporter [Acidobacteriota bacterium]